VSYITSNSPLRSLWPLLIVASAHRSLYSSADFHSDDTSPQASPSFKDKGTETLRSKPSSMCSVQYAEPEVYSDFLERLPCDSCVAVNKPYQKACATIEQATADLRLQDSYDRSRG